MCSWNGKQCCLHRKVYCEYNGLRLEDIEGLVVRHKCDNPRCINGAHLEMGSQKDNAQDCVRRGRRARRKPSLHKLTEEQVDAIRKEYIPGKVTQAQLGAKYGVGQDVISRIINRKRRYVSGT